MPVVVLFYQTASADAPSRFLGGKEVGWLLAIGTAAFWGWALIDVFRNRNLSKKLRIFWALLVLIIPVFGAMLYWSVGRRPDIEL